MADISGFSYSLNSRRVDSGSPAQHEFQFDLSFGDGILTYPVGGIPLDKVSLGLPNLVSELELFAQNTPDGFVYKLDKNDLKILMYAQSAAAAAGDPLIELSGAATPQGVLTIMAKGF